MGITFGDHLIDSGYHDITPEQERAMEQIDYNEPIDDAGHVVGDGLKADLAEARAQIAAKDAALRAGQAACDQFDAPLSDSDWVNGQATAAQQIRAALAVETNDET